MKFATFFVALGALFGLAMAEDLFKRLPVCSELGGPCDYRQFRCCTNQNLVCVCIFLHCEKPRHGND